ncbi:hypothetical protein Pelo_17386 [Pelomyxa schiedti]|nr:hypothetical protein Pelo_17386 [Pelomyxa schiedti]
MSGNKCVGDLVALFPSWDRSVLESVAKAHKWDAAAAAEFILATGSAKSSKSTTASSKPTTSSAASAPVRPKTPPSASSSAISSPGGALANSSNESGKRSKSKNKSRKMAKKLSVMFPDMEFGVIQTVTVANNNDVQACVNCLLSMQKSSPSSQSTVSSATSVKPAVTVTKNIVTEQCTEAASSSDLNAPHSAINSPTSVLPEKTTKDTALLSSPTAAAPLTGNTVQLSEEDSILLATVLSASMDTSIPSSAKPASMEITPPAPNTSTLDNVISTSTMTSTTTSTTSATVSLPVVTSSSEPSSRGIRELMEVFGEKITTDQARLVLQACGGDVDSAANQILMHIISEEEQALPPRSFDECGP